jgi:signal transduction histidine kinase
MRGRDYLRDNALLIATLAAALSLFALAMRLSAGPDGAPPLAADWLYAAGLADLCLLGGCTLDFLLRRRFFRVLSAAADRLRDTRGPGAGIDLRAQDPEAPPPGAWGTPAIVARALSAIERARRAEREAWRRERQSLVDSPAAWIHELKTPLSALRIILESRDRAETDQEALVGAIEEEVGRLESLLEAALYESRAESFDRDYLISEVDVRRLVSLSAAALSRAFMAAGVSFAMEEFSLRTPSDPKWLSFVLRQILLNAVKYTPRGGCVRVSVRSGPDSEELVIRDSGPGIAPRDLPRLFERGFTGEGGHGDPGSGGAASRSTGLGLYLSKRLCGKLGHGLSAESVPGAGSAFVIAFHPHTAYLDPAGRLSEM